MTKYKVELSKESREDLIDIAKYIKYKLKEPNISKKLINKLQKNINNLEYNPEIYPIIKEQYLEKLKLRKLLIENYFIFYRIKGHTVQIVRVMYARRNWNNLLK